MKLKANNALTLFILCFYMFTFGSFGVGTRWILILTLVLTTISAFCNSNDKMIYIGKLRKNWCVMVVVILMFINMPFARSESNVYNMVIFVIVASIGCLIIKTDEFELERVFKIFIYFALFFAIYISFFRILPEIYNSTIYNFLSVETKIRYDFGTQSGYGIPIGNSYTFADNVIQLGICAVAAKDLAEGESCMKNKIYILVMFLGILLEGRKGELFCSLITVMFIYYIGSNRSLKAFKNRFFFVVIAVGILILIGNLLFTRDLLFRFLLMFDRLGDSYAGQSVDFSSGRFALWEMAIDMFKDNPFLGVGWGGFGDHGSELEHLNNVHNCLLQLMCETGLIGTIMICLPMFVIIKKILKLGNFRKEKNTNFWKKRNNVFCAGVLFYLIILSFIDPNFYGAYFWYMLAIVVAISEHTIRFFANTVDTIRVPSNVKNNNSKCDSQVGIEDRHYGRTKI